MKRNTNWIKIVLINILILFCLLVACSLILRVWDSLTEDKGSVTSDFNSNTIRATYPNYKDYDFADAVNIFTDYAGPGTSYQPFIEWRRNSYAGKSVNVEDQYHTRLSSNHSFNDSFWFFGGSTMWGTGAKDEQTIPSYFAQISKHNVWNLGESAFNSFQELIQLQMLLVNGLNPKAVVFYDGINDGLYCNTNTFSLPNHSREDEYKESISSYKGMKKTIDRLNQKINTENHGSNLELQFKRVIYFIVEPYLHRLNKIFDKRSIGIMEKPSLATSRPLSSFKKENNYRDCDNNPQKAEAAARITVNTWLLAYELVASRNIPILFILQPTSQIGTQFHQLDYLVDTQKQRIIDEKDSYEIQYEMIRKVWREQCPKYNACDSFLDLSHAFDLYQEPIFIDSLHVSPNGNEIVAKEIFTAMCEKNMLKATLTNDCVIN